LRSFFSTLQKLSIVFIAGSLWMGAFVASYVLFGSGVEKVLAGTLANRLFYAVHWIVLISAAYLVLHSLWMLGGQSFKSSFFWSSLLLIVLVCIGHYGVQPIMDALRHKAMPFDIAQSIFRDRFYAWHGVASVLYVVECVIALVLVNNQRH